MSLCMSPCEVRIPTYKRPELLKRALLSLQSQTHKNWQALIFDDSPLQEAKPIVEALQDKRLLYQPNPANLGCAKNINRAFQSAPYLNSRYAFVLEDDNYLLPDFIAENINALNHYSVNIILRNQELRIEREGISTPTAVTTRGGWFEQGVYTPLEVHARLFFCEGVSNGGLFWDATQIQSHLQVSAKVEDAWHQELFRTLHIAEPIVFGATPLCIFTEFNSHRFNPTKNTTARIPRLSVLKHHRATQAILMALIEKHGVEVVQVAQKIAADRNCDNLLERRLLETFYFKHSFKSIETGVVLKTLLKASVQHLCLGNPFKAVSIP